MRYIICVILAAAHVFTPAFAKPRLNNSELTYQLACLEGGNSSKERVELCKAALEDVRLSDGDRLRLMLSLADAQTWESDYEGALRTYTEALALNPNSAVAYEGLGWVAHNQDQFPEAIEKFRQSIALELSASAQAGLGAALFRQSPDNVEAAVAELEKATLIDPEYDWAWAELGWVYMRSNQVDDAIAAFEEALKLSPNYIFALNNLASVYNTAEQYEQALDTANHLLSLQDNNWALLQRAEALRGLGRNMQALRDASVVIEQEPTWEDGYVSKALALEEMGLGGAAIEVYETLPEDVSRTDYSYYYQAWALQHDGQADAAMAAIEKAIALDLEDFSNWELKSLFLIYGEDYYASLAAARRATELQPRAEWSVLYQAISQAHLGEVEQAMALFDEAHNLNLPDGGTNWFVEHLIGLGLTQEAKDVREISKDR